MDFEGFEEGFSDTKNGKVFYLRRKSQGKPIIFLHGIGASLIGWNKLVPYLSKELDIYLVDLLGHGRSNAPDINYDVMTQVEMMEELVKNLKINQPTIFGHSYGGWVAILYSLRQETAGLIIEDSAGMDSQRLEVEKAGGREEYRRSLVMGAVKIGANPRVMRSAAANFDRYMLTDLVLSMVSSRTFIIWGDDDNVVPIRFGREMQEMIKDSDFLVIPEAGHVPHRTKPEIVAGAISRFCRVSTPSG